MSHVLVINPILYTSETNQIPKVSSVKDTMIYTLCMGFVKAGHRVTLIAASDYHPTEEERYDFPVIWMETVLHSVFQPRCLPYMPRLRGYLKEHPEYDCIVSSEMFATWSYTAARVCPRKTIIWHELAQHNNMFHKIPSRIWYNIVARFLMGSVTVVPRSEAAADFIGHFSHKVSGTVIDHGVDTDKITPVRAEDKKDRFVVVSQLIGRKRVDKIIDGFAEFYNQGYKAYSLYIIGRGELEAELKTQVKRLGLEQAVIFCGQLSHGELMPIVASSKALLVATEKDNNMVSIVESIAAGTPIVTTSVPYNAGYIGRYKLGIVEDGWNGRTLERICDDNAVYTENCLAYRERLSNVYCAGQFLSVMSREV